MTKRVMLSWSSGKDSAWALHLLRSDPDVELAGLFTTVNREFDRVAMHAVRRTLLDAQAARIGLPLDAIPIPYPCPNETYETVMSAFVEEAKRRGVTHFAFGDLFLEDIRRYREEKLAGTGIGPLFPLWGLPTRALAREMVAGGLRAYITCVDPKQAPREWAGRLFDAAFVNAVPENIDPCGEHGEFRTFAFDGPMFHHSVEAVVGKIVERDGFVFADRRLPFLKLRAE
ncbi:MAG: adenine nucleotide alpha hydrolase [Candidatus Binataceae bacterium]|nr:adenine nucleotide alpha hydrolase [Candidatus Binataceae bacterium]